jgi:CheY-like chemotaxis protein
MSARNRVILVAEDDTSVQRLLHFFLIKNGFDVWLASDGAEAVEIYREHAEEIDLVLMDVHMPVLDGPVAFRQMREINPGVLCCFMTGGNNCEDEDCLLRRGAAFILHKPFRITEVPQTVLHLLFNRVPHDAPAWLARNAEPGRLHATCP